MIAEEQYYHYSQELGEVIEEIQELNELVETLKSLKSANMYEVENRQALRTLNVDPPAVAYCRADGNYYFKYSDLGALKNTPYFSGIGDGWHNMDAPSPQFDRLIHIVTTQWLNGINLDYFPDFIEVQQSARDLDELQGIFGTRYGPPSSEYNTEISLMKPGEFIYRSQYYQGRIGSNKGIGSQVISLLDLDKEIPDKWFTSRNFPLNENDYSVYNSGSILVIDGEEYEILDHFPNHRTVSDGGIYFRWVQGLPYYDRAPQGSETADEHDSRYNAIWRGCGLPTTKVYIRGGLRKPITAESSFYIYNRQWYIVSCEKLDHCPGHKFRCWDYMRMAGHLAPARFSRRIHTIGDENEIKQFYLQKKILPGDLIFHEQNSNYYQILPPYRGKVYTSESYSSGYFGAITVKGLPNILQMGSPVLLQDTEYILTGKNGDNIVLDRALETEVDNDSECLILQSTFADFTRILTVKDKSHFQELDRLFDFNNLFICNLTHTDQRYRRSLPLFGELYSVVEETWNQLLHPVEIRFRKGEL